MNQQMEDRKQACPEPDLVDSACTINVQLNQSLCPVDFNIARDFPLLVGWVGSLYLIRKRKVNCPVQHKRLKAETSTNKEIISQTQLLKRGKVISCLLGLCA